jgi:hypothetical protein
MEFFFASKFLVSLTNAMPIFGKSFGDYSRAKKERKERERLEREERIRNGVPTPEDIKYLKKLEKKNKSNKNGIETSSDCIFNTNTNANQPNT